MLRSHRSVFRRGLAIAMVVGLAASLDAGTTVAATHAAPAAAPAPAPAGSATAAAVPNGVPSPDSALGSGWRTSSDRAMTAIGDASGFHILVADASKAYSWRTAASLSEPGFDTDQWIGQACSTASGRYAFVVYAPRRFATRSTQFDQGAFAAIVDLTSGAVRKLPFLAGLAYYDPGCGNGESAVLSSAVTDAATGAARTTLRVVDAATGRVTQQSTVAGQLTSALPYRGAVAAARGDQLVSVGKGGGIRTLTHESGIPFRLAVDTSGALGYQVPTAAGQVQVRRLAGGRAGTVGTAKLGAVQLKGSGGHVFLVGPAAAKVNVNGLAAKGWKSLAAPAESEPSTTGGLVVTGSSNTDNASGTAETDGKSNDSPLPVSIQAKAIGSGAQVSMRVLPQAGTDSGGARPSPALPDSAGTSGSAASAGTGATRSAAKTATPAKATPATSTDAATETYDPDRACAVARNDPSIQTYQATAQQVEWAADLAVQGQLTRSRAAGWEGSGMSVPWTPQGMFPLQPLSGGGQVPAQVLLGILAQESNTLQASPHAPDAITGNVNQGGFYGNGSDWSTADCGYGVGQVTTGMQMSTPAGTDVADGSSSYTTAQQQQAIATDYASNIAASLNLLIDKWNQLKAAGIVANDGGAQYIENWYFAVWAYNSGVQPGAALGNSTGCTPSPTCTDGAGNWGMGWANNPANPVYPADRGTFTNSAADTKVPNHWPYQELVMGWAYSPVPRFNYASGKWGPAYAAAAAGSAGAGPALPPFSAFCTSDDLCQPNAAADANGTADSAGLCTNADLHCWWHLPRNWTACDTYCGTSNPTYTSASAVPTGTDIDPPDCRALGTASGSPSSDSYGAAPPTGSIVVRSTDVPSVASCTQTWTDQGSFGIRFNAANSCNVSCTDPIDYPGKIDFHQLGVGFGGHTWFAHTRPPSDTADTVVGTWTPPAIDGWAKVYVHLPDIASMTQEAPYTVSTGSGLPETRYVNAHRAYNQWVELGVFSFDSSGGGESVSLTNATPDGDGSMDIAWDSVAFQPLPAKPRDVVVQMGDSYTSGEGAEPYLPGTDNGPYADQVSDSSSSETWNACHRSQNSWFRKTTLPGRSGPVGALADAFNSSLDFQSTACSGALTWEFDPALSTGPSFGSDGEFHEVQQLDAGYLDSSTTLVALTIGGNDAKFSKTIQQCVLLGCPSDSSVTTNINNVGSNLTTLLQDIAGKAPNAKIVLLGYPKLFGSGGVSCGDNLVASDAATQLDTWAGDMDTMEAKAVAAAAAGPSVGSRLSFWSAESSPAYFTGYRVCGPTTSGINQVVSAPATAGGDFSCPASPDPRQWLCVSRESFHPNNTGTDRYSLIFSAALTAAGY
ncbi:golvesin C-terminal-like domain-containing protein [Streptacidiphilus cavernicola]|uniref:Golvesin/Xly CBD-like domain-containing protein n=1 Tax=Streptacidiphilus cavernicola TaxID=3342716 RepID=A0ABV6W4U3_9ACTN